MQSINQNLNTKSSTESDLAVVDDFLIQLIWNKYFLKEKGYYIHDNIIYQDNQSTIKLENNSRISISNRKRHINIRYFLLMIGSWNRRNTWNYVPPWTWLRITSLSHYWDTNYVASVTSFLLSMTMTSHTKHVCKIFSWRTKTKIEEQERRNPEGCQTHMQIGKPRSVLGEVY